MTDSSPLRERNTQLKLTKASPYWVSHFPLGTKSISSFLKDSEALKEHVSPLPAPSPSDIYSRPREPTAPVLNVSPASQSPKFKVSVHEHPWPTSAQTGLGPGQAISQLAQEMLPHPHSVCFRPLISALLALWFQWYYSLGLPPQACSALRFRTAAF